MTIEIHQPQHPLSNRVQFFEEIYLNRELFDIDIHCRDSSPNSSSNPCLRAHKVVLAAVSPMIRRMLSGSFVEAGQSSITVDVERWAFERMLEFVYTGTTQVQTVEQLVKLGQVADHFDIEQLRECTLALASELLCVESCAMLLQASSISGLGGLEEVSRAFFCRRFCDVAKTDGFLALDEDVLASVLSSDELYAPSEEAVYEHLERWIMASGRVALSGDAQAPRGLQLLRQIRFPLMDGKYLALNIHQGKGPLSQTALLKDLTTEAALWQIVPLHSKPLFRRQHLSEAALRQRCRPDLWRPHCLRTKQTLQGQDEVQALVLVDGRLVSGSVDSTICVWNTHTWRCERRLEGHQQAVCALEVCGRRLYSGSVDTNIMVWDVVTWRMIGSLRGHTKSVFALKATMGAGGGAPLLFSGSDDCTIKVWEIGSDVGTCRRSLGDHDKAVCALERHGDKSMLSGSFDCTIRVWDVATLTCVRVLAGHASGVCTLTVCGPWLVSGSSEVPPCPVSGCTQVRVWELATWRAAGQLEWAPTDGEPGVNELVACPVLLPQPPPPSPRGGPVDASPRAPSPDSGGGMRESMRVIGGFNDGWIRVWDPSRARPEYCFNAHAGRPVYSVLVVPASANGGGPSSAMGTAIGGVGPSGMGWSGGAWLFSASQDIRAWSSEPGSDS